VTLRATFHNNDFDFTKATEADVCFAFIVRLSFRLRVPNFYHCHFVSQHGEYDLWVKNRAMETTEPMMWLHALHRAGGKIDDLWSTVAVMPNRVRLTPEELESLRTCHGDMNKVALVERVNKNLWPAMQALNAFIIGYHTTTGELFGGTALQTLTVHEYMDALTTEVVLIGVPMSYWTEATIGELFEIKAEREVRLTASLTGDMFDLPAERLAPISQAIARINTFYFYELAFEAKAKMVNSDYIGALLMAVAALEGVHGAYVTHVLGDKLPAGRTGDDAKLEENYIRELGFSVCNKTTPCLLMDPAERPTQVLIDGAATAVKYRNEIMHALRSSSGGYRIRTRTNAEISDAYSAALQLFDHYRKALERLVPTPTVGE
jgi:hypothetical protein